MALSEQGLNWKYHLNFAIIPKRLFSPFYRWGNWISKRQKDTCKVPHVTELDLSPSRGCTSLTAWLLLQSSPRDNFAKPRDRRGWAGRGEEERAPLHPSSASSKTTRAPGWGAPPRQSWAAAPSSQYCRRSLACAQRRRSPSNHGSRSCPA